MIECLIEGTLQSALAAVEFGDSVAVLAIADEGMAQVGLGEGLGASEFCEALLIGLVAGLLAVGCGYYKP